MDEYNIQDTAENGEVPEAESLPENEGEFTLKHLDRTLSVDRDEVIRLAQKGLDYDRVKSRYYKLIFTSIAGATATLTSADIRVRYCGKVR